MKNLILLLLLSLLSCSRNFISIEYVDVLNDAIYETIQDLEKSKFAPRSNIKSKDIFVLVSHCEYTTTLTFNFIDNMPSTVKSQIKKSRRSITVEHVEIPIIFYFDSNNSAIRTGGTNHGLIGGMLIHFNGAGEVIMKGPVH